MKVLRVSAPTGRARHQRVALEGGLTLRVRPDDVVALGLAPGVELDVGAVDALRAGAELARATEAALRLLAIRLRSRHELDDRLRRRDIPEEARRRVLDRLTEAGLLDDLRFARSWIEGRLTMRPSGAVRLRAELRRAGVAPEVIAQALRESPAGADEHHLALEVARTRIRRYRSDPPEVAYRRLAGVLQRRGFSAGAIARALREVFPS